MTLKLSNQVNNYIKNIIKIIDNDTAQGISIILFGSAIEGGYSPDKSDVDVIIVIDDSVPAAEKKKLDVTLTQLEFTYGFREQHTSKIDFGYKFAENITGMFISHFICYRSDFVAGNFTEIFNVNPLLSFLLAPKSIVLASVLSAAKTVWGENLLPQVAVQPISKLQVLKSCCMNVTLAVMALLTYSLHIEATKFSMEALKWSLYNCYICFTQQSAQLEDVIAYFKKIGTQNPLLTILLTLRKRYLPNPYFVIRCPVLVLTMHRKTLDTLVFPIYVASINKEPTPEMKALFTT